MYELRLSVTDLDQLRYYERSDDMTLEAIIERFQKPWEATDAMLRGQDFHAALEKLRSPREGAVEVEQVQGPNGWVFDFSELDVTLPDLPIREQFTTARYRLPDGTLVRVGGKVDAMGGLDAADYKLTGGKPPDPEEYAYAWQWRVYLWMTGLRRFRYWVFTHKKPQGNLVPITNMVPIPLMRYPGMEAECTRAMEHFASFARQFLPGKWEPAQAPGDYRGLEHPEDAHEQV